MTYFSMILIHLYNDKKTINKDKYLFDVTKNWGYFGICYLAHANWFTELEINNKDW